VSKSARQADHQLHVFRRFGLRDANRITHSHHADESLLFINDGEPEKACVANETRDFLLVVSNAQEAHVWIHDLTDAPGGGRENKIAQRNDTASFCASSVA